MKVVKATAASIRRAAEILQRGGLAIVPTETVYGVAANALDRDAVARLYAAKGRPAENPLIVHVHSIARARALAAEWPKDAETLAKRFWPGPLTLVVRRNEELPDAVAGGLDTVGIRIPSNSIALAILEAADLPLAAPSANPFMGLSATRVENLAQSLVDKVDIVVDGGPCEVGLESTVIDMTADPPRILRPGGVSRGDIQAALRRPLGSTPPKGPRRSPGMYRRHYAPRCALRIVAKLEPGACGLGFDVEPSARRIRMPSDPSAYAYELYASLARLDAQRPREIQVEAPPDEPEWEAVWDRLRRASSRA